MYCVRHVGGWVYEMGGEGVGYMRPDAKIPVYTDIGGAGGDRYVTVFFTMCVYPALLFLRRQRL